jgi:hypothetical protein
MILIQEIKKVKVEDKNCHTKTMMSTIDDRPLR